MNRLPDHASHVVVGAGPAGLTAAFELARTGHAPLVLEASPWIGGIARTHVWGGNRIDIGGHRFFTKSDDVKRLWAAMMDEPMLQVPRLSRIFYRGRFYRYPLLRMNVGFADGYSMPSRLATALGLHPRVMHLGLAALLLVLVPVLFWKRVFTATRVEPLFLAAIAAVLGGSLLYHLFYDNIMMFPLLFAALAAAAHRPTPGRLAIAATVGVSLWIPQQMLEWVHGEWLLRPAVWAISSVALFVSQMRHSPQPIACQTAGSVAD